MDGQRFVKINRDGREERLIITKTLWDHARCIASRATTCWKAYREADESKKPFVVKDFWQYIDRPEEGELIRKATAAGVTNISQYYHHESVRFNGQDDVIRSNVRKGMSAEGSGNPFTEQASTLPETTKSSQASSFGVGGSSQASALSGTARFRLASHSPEAIKARCVPPNTLASPGSQASRKRLSSQIETLLPLQKRSRSIMTTKGDEHRLAEDRVRRHIISNRFGKSLQKASSLAAILTGILGGLKGEPVDDLLL